MMDGKVIKTPENLMERFYHQLTVFLLIFMYLLAHTHPAISIRVGAKRTPSTVYFENYEA